MLIQQVFNFLVVLKTPRILESPGNILKLEDVPTRHQNCKSMINTRIPDIGVF